MRVYFVTLMIALGMLTSGCTTIMRQVEETKNLSRCEFRLASFENLQFGGVVIPNVASLDKLNLSDALKLQSLALSRDWPLAFTLNVEARNRNAGLAAMNRFEWILFMDDLELMAGLLERRTEIPGKGAVTVIPLQIKVDLKRLLTDTSFQSALNLLFNLSGAGNQPTRFLLKAKPSIMVGAHPLSYPGYLHIRQDFTAEMGQQLQKQYGL